MRAGGGYETWSAPAQAKRRGDDNPDRKFVASLARGLEVLRAFTPSEGLLGNRDIAQRTGLPKPTVSRLTYTLTKLGYLTHVERIGKYQLAPGALAIGYSTLANMRIRQVARPFMRDLAEYAGASVALGTRDRLNVIYVEHVRSPQSVLLRLDLGSRLPIATTAIGRALLAALPEAERDWLMQHIAKREGDAWPKVRARIESAVEEVRQHGFTVSLGEWQQDVTGVAVPVVPSDRSGVFAFNCGAPAFQISRERLETDIGPRLVNLARNVEAAVASA
ncbi:MAG: IclR family transcriptional regulator [Variibacter sp.]|nr:IclR family transcriptional regulator [Variibacter sp.]